jgi:hypothetical protein
VPYEAERKADVERYRQFIVNELYRSPPDVHERILRYDEVVRNEMARPGPDARIRYFGECRTNDSLFTAIVGNPAPSAYSGAFSTHSAPKPRYTSGKVTLVIRTGLAPPRGTPFEERTTP